MKLLATFLIMILGCLDILATPLDIRILNSVKTSSSDESRSLLIDHKGQLWFGTTSGLKRFDGYGITTYRSDAISPNILPNNTVFPDRRPERPDMDRNTQWTCLYGQAKRHFPYIPSTSQQPENHIHPLHFQRWSGMDRN